MEENKLESQTKSIGIDDLLAGNKDLYSSFEETLPFVKMSLSSLVERIRSIESNG